MSDKFKFFMGKKDKSSEIRDYLLKLRKKYPNATDAELMEMVGAGDSGMVYRCGKKPKFSFGKSIGKSVSDGFKDYTSQSGGTGAGITSLVGQVASVASSAIKDYNSIAKEPTNNTATNILDTVSGASVPVSEFLANRKPKEKKQEEITDESLSKPTVKAANKFDKKSTNPNVHYTYF